MVLLKSGLGAKVALAVLGVVLGFGGISAGASWHAAHMANPAHRRLFVGQVISFDGTTLVIKAHSGRIITLTVLPKRTIVRHHGKAAQLADVRPGEQVLIRATQRKGKIYVLFISILKPKELPQGP